MVRMTMKLLAAVVAALFLAGSAVAGTVNVDGGTPFEQQQVRLALAASKFDYGQIPAPVTVHVVPPSDAHLEGGVDAGYSIPGEVWISSRWLDFGAAGWGFVQHEFGHEIDYYVLTDAQRAALLSHLDPTGSTTSWCDHSVAYDARPCEWFASELSWAFWPVGANLQDPTTTKGLSGHLPPDQFRAAVESLGLAQPTRVCTTRTVPGHWTRKHGKKVWVRRHLATSCTLRP